MPRGKKAPKEEADDRASFRGLSPAATVVAKRHSTYGFYGPTLVKDDVEFLGLSRSDVDHPDHGALVTFFGKHQETFGARSRLENRRSEQPRQDLRGEPRK